MEFVTARLKAVRGPATRRLTGGASGAVNRPELTDNCRIKGSGYISHGDREEKTKERGERGRSGSNCPCLGRTWLGAHVQAVAARLVCGRSAMNGMTMTVHGSSGTGRGGSVAVVQDTDVTRSDRGRIRITA